MSRLSTTPNAQIMTEARAALSGRWALAVGMSAVLFGIALVSAMLGHLGSLLDVLIKGPLEIGVATVFLQFIRGQESRVSQLFCGFDRFVTGLAAYLLMILFIFLWALLLIVPGVIAMLSYAMTFYILADEPGIGARAAIAKSKIMMFGNKWKYFCLICRFAGWFLLGVATLGIGFLWIVPYMMTSFARFYLDLCDLPAEIAPPAVPAEAEGYHFGDE
ncbi:MAG: DUF975 family protein [Paludibacterium sp.]|uniref:DUF975 family protein n=1 Tax=Paludibacterium sp. TaxID=1917523 RepID=UPI0025FCDC38|nr:DUF975 family protein [Paludibacterium sp.]MBV8046085.1 DUF975 family protein [Paludibacterium sp.]MBV8647418.1 DUF975 family protein [Paludibacterium sp.]